MSLMATSFMLPTLQKDGVEVTIFCEYGSQPTAEKFDETVAHIWAWLTLKDAISSVEGTEDALYAFATSAYARAISQLKDVHCRKAFLNTAIPRIIFGGAPQAIRALVRLQYEKEAAHA